MTSVWVLRTEIEPLRAEMKFAEKPTLWKVWLRGAIKPLRAAMNLAEKPILWKNSLRAAIRSFRAAMTLRNSENCVFVLSKPNWLNH